MAERLTVIRGDDTDLAVTILDVDDAVVDLEPFNEATFTLKRSRQDTDAAAVFQGTLTGDDLSFSDPTTEGIVSIHIPASATGVLRSGKVYYWDLQLESDTRIYTPYSGELLCTEDSTRG